jgi:SAM-dependent methyltransferase
MVFGNYAHYYNLLYRDKDYKGEVDYIQKLITQFSTNKVESILDLGCGTGTHVNLLSQKGYSVAGVDRSQKMIDIAKTRKTDQTEFFLGDITTINLEKQFDVIVSLFHVISYITNNEDLDAFFRNISKHLKNNGLLIFDCWYGPAVLTDRPATRIKRLEDEKITITRIAEPVMHPNENIVDVRYEVIIEDKVTKKTDRILEVHPMRYFFKPEMELFFERYGFELLQSEEWMTGKPVGFDTWGACWVVKKSGSTKGMMQ